MSHTALNPPARPPTFPRMPLGRLLRLVLVALPALFGTAAGASPAHASRTGPAAAASTIGTPTQSLPAPVHDEATCAFCQAAVFPPCAPQPTSIWIESTWLLQHEQVAPQAAQPHSTSHRPASSRAPPPLRSA
jgi:hypothetical protein